MRCYLTSSYIAMNFIKKWPNIDPAVACRVLTIRRKKNSWWVMWIALIYKLRSWKSRGSLISYRWCANWDAHDMADVDKRSKKQRTRERERRKILLIYNNSSDKKVWIVKRKTKSAAWGIWSRTLNNLLCSNATHPLLWARGTKILN